MFFKYTLSHSGSNSSSSLIDWKVPFMTSFSKTSTVFSFILSWWRNVKLIYAVEKRWNLGALKNKYNTFLLNSQTLPVLLRWLKQSIISRKSVKLKWARHFGMTWFWKYYTRLTHWIKARNNSSWRKRKKCLVFSTLVAFVDFLGFLRGFENFSNTYHFYLISSLPNSSN